MRKSVVYSLLLFVFVSSVLFAAGPVEDWFQADLRLDLNLTWDGAKDAAPTLDPGEKEDKSGKQKKKLGRALLFNMSIWLLDSIRYWAKYSKWIEDWQYKLTWEDQKKRFFSFQANKFDSNPFITNWTHGLSGAIYYNIARYHRLNPLQSLLFEFCSSLWWEYVTEWREVISVNDNFFSGIGGVPIGEPLFQIGNYFSQQRGLLSRIIGTILNPVISLNDLLGGRKKPWRIKPPEFAQPRFDLYFGQERASFKDEPGSALDLFNVRIESRYHTIRGWGQPGRSHRFVKDTLFSEVHIDMTFGTNRLEEFQLFTRAVFIGLFSQDIKKSASDGLKGHSLFFGLGSAFDFFKKRGVIYYDQGEYHFDFAGGEQAPLPTQFTDKFAIINLFGPVFDLVLYSGRFESRLAFDAYFDFALVNALALNEYSQYHDIYQPRMKATLSHYGYHYAFGCTLSAAAGVRYGNFEIDGRLKYQYYDSIEGLDRFQDRIENDSNITDSRLMYRLQVGYTLPRSPVALVLTWEGIDRRGTIEEISRRETETRIYSQLRLSF